MSTDVGARERAMLDRLKESYEHQGYQVFTYPLPEILPEFLHGFQPDAIALKPDENLVIEVKMGRRPGEERRLESLGKLVTGQPGWKLKVFYESQTPDDVVRLSLATHSQIEAQIEEAERLADQGHERAAFLVAWSVLEALTRALISPDDLSAARPFSPAQIVQSLEMAGHVHNDAARELRSQARLRNLVAHGDLSAEVDKKAVADLIELNRALADAVFAQHV